MTRCFPLFVSALLCTVILSASPDKRLATVRHAYVVAIDELERDASVAKCVATHLHEMTPIESVASKSDADVILRVRANIPSATARVMVGSMGGTPSVHMYAELPDGTKLWDDGAKLRRAIDKAGRLKTGDGTADTIDCALADEMLNTLRDAMKQARDSKSD